MMLSASATMLARSMITVMQVILLLELQVAIAHRIRSGELMTSVMMHACAQDISSIKDHIGTKMKKNAYAIGIQEVRSIMMFSCNARAQMALIGIKKAGHVSAILRLLEKCSTMKPKPAAANLEPTGIPLPYRAVKDALSQDNTSTLIWASAHSELHEPLREEPR